MNECKHNEWILEWMNECKKWLMHEWISEWINEWMNEWMDEVIVNEWMKK